VAQIVSAIAAQHINIADMLNHSRRRESRTRSAISTRRRTKAPTLWSHPRHSPDLSARVMPIL